MGTFGASWYSQLLSPVLAESLGEGLGEQLAVMEENTVSIFSTLTLGSRQRGYTTFLGVRDLSRSQKGAKISVMNV